MTPGATVEAAIGLLQAIDEGRGPADDIVGTYFRRHRFAGAKDRGAISEHVYAVLRHRAALDWWIARAERTRTSVVPTKAGTQGKRWQAALGSRSRGNDGEREAEPQQESTSIARRRMLAALVLVEDWTPQQIARACDGD